MSPVVIVAARRSPIGSLAGALASELAHNSQAAVRDTIHNRPIRNNTALASAECPAAYRNLPELQR